MTINHRIKTWFARFRWYRRTIATAMRFNDEYKNYIKIFDMHRAIHEELLAEQRTAPSSKKIPLLTAQLEILTRILNNKAL